MLDYPALVAALREMFRAGCEMPARHHHPVAVPGEPQATLLLMPAWRPGESLGVKIVSVFPGNGAKGLASVTGQYLLLDAKTGAPRALIDGPALTARRTAAASALAATYLARADAASLVVVGTGALAPELIAAHCSTRPIERVRCGAGARTRRAAPPPPQPFRASGSRPPEAARRASPPPSPGRISYPAPPCRRRRWCAAPGSSPASTSTWSAPTRPKCAKPTTTPLRRARVYVDTRAGATKEAGDIVQPLASGALKPEGIVGDLFELTRGTAQGRREASEITFFKSVGAALEDLAAATLIARRAGV